MKQTTTAAAQASHLIKMASFFYDHACGAWKIDVSGNDQARIIGGHGGDPCVPDALPIPPAAAGIPRRGETVTI